MLSMFSKTGQISENLILSRDAKYSVSNQSGIKTSIRMMGREERRDARVAATEEKILQTSKRRAWSLVVLNTLCSSFNPLLPKAPTAVSLCGPMIYKN